MKLSVIQIKQYKESLFFARLSAKNGDLFNEHTCKVYYSLPINLQIKIDIFFLCLLKKYYVNIEPFIQCELF